MAQADGTVDNGSGFEVRSGINTQLAAAFTNHSGITAPNDTFANQWWVDTSSASQSDPYGVLNIRDTENSGYTPLRETDGKVILPAGSVTGPSVYFNGETNTGIYRYAADVIGITVNGTNYGVIGRTLESQTQAFAVGEVATRTTAKNPSNDTDGTAEGFSLSTVGIVNASANANAVMRLNRTGTTGKIVGLHYNGLERGSIRTTNGTTIDFNEGSDYRLKENIVDLDDAKARLNALQPRRFNFIETPQETRDGFIAHEVAPVVPEAVFGERDEVDSDGNPEYQGFNAMRLIPLLTAALQEAFTEIDALRARIDTLEAN